MWRVVAPLHETNMLNAIDLLSRFSRSVLGITALSVINTSFQRGRSNPRAVTNRFSGLSWHNSAEKPLQRLWTRGLVCSAQLKQGVKRDDRHKLSLRFLSLARFGEIPAARATAVITGHAEIAAMMAKSNASMANSKLLSLAK